MAADIGAAIVGVGLVIAYSWIWKGANSTVPSVGQPAPNGRPGATPMYGGHDAPRSGPEGLLKIGALRACRAAAEDYGEEYPRSVDTLLAKVAAWEAVPGHADRQGWAVYRELGLLRRLVGEPLLRDPEAAVLRAVTSVVDPVH